MTRFPIQLIDIQLGTTVLTGASYVVPGTVVAAAESPATTVTISSATANNSTATPVTLTVYKIPPSSAAGLANEMVSVVSIPARGSAATTLPGLVGQHLRAGWTLAALCSAATAVNLNVSGYLTTP